MIRRGVPFYRLILPIFASLSVGCHAPTAVSRSSNPPATAPATPFPVLIHLPGIGGEMPLDRSLVRNLVVSGVAPGGTIYDWTGTDRGLAALLNDRRKQVKADDVTELIARTARRTPGVPIVLVAHSAGTGVAVQALERLPPGVQVRTLVLLASALSPEYDLTPALAHVQGRCVSFYSPYDKYVLGAGTRTMGTYDGVHTDAAGYVGFRVPKQYHSESVPYGTKLLQLAYQEEWAKLGYGGDHIGITAGPFVRRVIAPLVRQDESDNAGRPPVPSPNTPGKS